eukprot:8369696-Heterocapsa_arctica.AAC.1
MGDAACAALHGGGCLGLEGQGQGQRSSLSDAWQRQGQGQDGQRPNPMLPLWSTRASTSDVHEEA